MAVVGETSTELASYGSSVFADFQHVLQTCNSDNIAQQSVWKAYTN